MAKSDKTGLTGQTPDGLWPERRTPELLARDDTGPADAPRGLLKDHSISRMLRGGNRMAAGQAV
jgi:hypothetical protein